MARALRPAVALIVLASLLFLVAGRLDHLSGVGEYLWVESYAFGVVNLIVAVAIARGSERILALRIVLAAFFVVERPATAILFPTSLAAFAVHLLTALVELVVLVSTLRVWRLGHGVAADISLLSLTSELPTSTPPSEGVGGNTRHAR